jgi:hypothetical protein
MTNETLTAAEAFQLMAENVENGKYPGEGMEVMDKHGVWHQSKYPPTGLLINHCADGRVRRAPRYIEVAGVRVPEPFREEPRHKQIYWFVCSTGLIRSWGCLRDPRGRRSPSRS